MKELIDLLLESKTHQVTFFMLLSGIAGSILIYLLEHKLRRRKRVDQEIIFDKAREMGCSEFDIFKMAAKDWNFSDLKVEEDFRAYIRTNELPHYVSSYLHANGENDE
ncbi:MAG: hypothetical protein JSV21_02820 [Nitrospirota bacterium]|nr:MAG: hypothetical protein JSV21_02820 [Nitrospirota bacterium]